MKGWVMALAGIATMFVVALIGSSMVVDVVITVDPTRTHQTMKGWEVSAFLWEQNKKEDRYDPSWRDHKDELFDRLVNELGIDRVRIEIRSGAENPVDYWTPFERQQIGYREMKRYRYEKINDNRDARLANKAGFQFAELDYQVQNVLLPLRRRVEANREKLFINLTYVDFGGTEKKGNLSHAREPEEYAELIHLTFDHLRQRYGITPDALEIILEPDNSDHWRGREIGAAMVAAVRRLREAGFSPEVIAPSTASARRAVDYIDRMMAVPGAADVISTFAYHRYDGASASVALPRIRERAARFGVGTAMLEHLTGDVAELHDDLTKANVSAWQQFGIAYRSSPERERGGGYHYLVDLGGREKPTVRMASRTRELAQYFRFVRAGAVRIDATSNDGDKRAVAFRNANGGHIVVVQAHRSGGTMSVVGVPAGSYGVRYTTADETGRELPAIGIGAGQALTAQLPAKGVITFYQKVSSAR